MNEDDRDVDLENDIDVIVDWDARSKKNPPGLKWLALVWVIGMIGLIGIYTYAWVSA